MTVLRRAVEWTWYADGAAAGLVRGALQPLSWAFSQVVRMRNARYDAQPPAPTSVPAISIGNLSVGGTGKTPVASWFAARLRARGGRPALVLRGYGDDEWRVHELLTPDVPVHVSPDRLAAMEAVRVAGGDCAVLDDAFQHRRAPRQSDVVLVSADRWTGREAVLPAGPFREPLSGLRRASAVAITVKAASPARVRAVLDRLASAAPHLDPAVIRLAPRALHRVGGAPEVPALGVTQLAGARVLALSAVADPVAFGQQLRDCGAILVHEERFPDHHEFTASDVSRVSGVLHGAELVVCTLKDAVKLAALWPRAATPLWYVSQTVVVERGAEVLERECDRVLAAR